MADLEAEYRLILDREYKKRVAKNDLYSKNSFSKKLQVSSSYYSKLMKGEILLPVDRANEMAFLLELSHEERKKFVLSCAEEQKCHALYLIDPIYTDCNPDLADLNKYPFSRKNKN